MEINKENVDAVVSVLKMGKLDEALLTVRDITELAKQLIEEHPDLTAEEIGAIYEEEQTKIADEQSQNNMSKDMEK